MFLKSLEKIVSQGYHTAFSNTYEASPCLGCFEFLCRLRITMILKIMKYGLEWIGIFPFRKIEQSVSIYHVIIFNDL